MAKPRNGPGRGWRVVTLCATIGSPEASSAFTPDGLWAKKNWENRVSRKSRSPMATLAGSGRGRRSPLTPLTGIFGSLKRGRGEAEVEAEKVDGAAGAA